MISQKSKNFGLQEKWIISGRFRRLVDESEAFFSCFEVLIGVRI